MTQASELDTAGSGDRLTGDRLQASIDGLTALADSLNPWMETETDVAAAQAIGRAQQGLRSLAQSLAVAQIELLAGQAKITAEHITAAVDYSCAGIDKLHLWQKRVEKIGKLLEFFAVVQTGNGGKILQAAGDLKSALDAG
jgi:hypothetical protein